MYRFMFMPSAILVLQQKTSRSLEDFTAGDFYR